MTMLRKNMNATSHEAARSVDVTIARARRGGSCSHRQVQHHCLRIMGTGFDNFTPRAYAYATDGVGPKAEANRALLRHAMKHGGIDALHSRSDRVQVTNIHGEQLLARARSAERSNVQQAQGANAAVESLAKGSADRPGCSGDQDTIHT